MATDEWFAMKWQDVPVEDATTDADAVPIATSVALIHGGYILRFRDGEMAADHYSYVYVPSSEAHSG